MAESNRDWLNVSLWLPVPSADPPAPPSKQPQTETSTLPCTTSTPVRSGHGGSSFREPRPPGVLGPPAPLLQPLHTAHTLTWPRVAAPWSSGTQKSNQHPAPGLDPAIRPVASLGTWAFWGFLSHPAHLVWVFGINGTLVGITSPQPTRAAPSHDRGLT